MDMANYLDIYGIFVNELAGSIWLFILISLVLIYYLGIKSKMTTEVTVILAMVFISIIVAKTGMTFLWALVILLAGGLFYYKYQKVIRRG